MTYAPRHLIRWTRPDSYFGAEWLEYFSSGFGQSRDSSALERSNFICALRELGGESETVIVVREGHWAVGWVEWIAIHESDGAALRKADELVKCYRDYPVVDEDHFTSLEDEDAQEIWSKCYDNKGRLDYIKKNASQFDFRDFKDLMAQVRGKYFGGYASELIS